MATAATTRATTEGAADSGPVTLGGESGLAVVTSRRLSLAIRGTGKGAGARCQTAPVAAARTRRWRVVGGLLVDRSMVLLVANRRGVFDRTLGRRNGRLEWTPPGGVVDPGEEPLTALSREVVEETGLVVEGWSEVLYRVSVEFPDRDMVLGVDVHRALSWTGEVVLADPDHIVEDARFVDVEAAGPLLATAPRWVREPVTEWLAGSEAGESAVLDFSYVAYGPNSGDLTVERLDPRDG
ncbi:MAG: hypothetical protein CL468_05765 [Acidimicrobiaceae bacterium]|nr:hypothetical protein [Acidimicrobiaceae bacterium]